MTKKTNTPERNYTWAGDGFLCNSTNSPRAIFYAGGLCWLKLATDVEINLIFKKPISAHHYHIRMMHQDGPYSMRDGVYIDQTGVITKL